MWDYRRDKKCAVETRCFNSGYPNKVRVAELWGLGVRAQLIYKKHAFFECDLGIKESRIQRSRISDCV